MTQTSRPALAHRFEVPTRDQVAARLEELVQSDGPGERAAAAAWAAEYIAFDDPQVYPEVEDPAVWAALTALSGADLPTTDRAYLHGRADFEQWLGELRRAQ